MIYLDHAATTPVDPRVKDAMLPWLGEHCGNPSSIHAAGREARLAVEEAREKVAALVDAAPKDILFTAGGTEADNVALAAAREMDGRSDLVTAASEHHAVLHAAEHSGCTVRILPVESDASVSMDAVREALSPNTALLSIMSVNNETGALNDIAGLSELANSVGALFHTDAVQAAGKIPLSMRSLPIDYASFAAHKLHGPKGVGALYVRGGRPVPKFFHGGGQERARRAGTENVPGIVGFGEAAYWASRELQDRRHRWKVLRERMECFFHDGYPGVVINGRPGQVLDSILSVTFPWDRFHLDGEALVINLDMEGLAVSSGSACTSGSLHASHVMLAVGHDVRSAAATLRFSFGAGTTEHEVDEASRLLSQVLDRMIPT